MSFGTDVITKNGSSQSGVHLLLPAVWWYDPGHSATDSDATADSGSPVVVLASLLHCGESSVW